MSSTEHDLTSFSNFARHAIASGQIDLSIDELFDQWRVENPSDVLYTENVAAIRASLNDFKSGERGTAAGEHSSQLRREFGLPEA
jgi:hypothetical protein